MLTLKDRPNQPLIAPSILSADFGHMIDECQLVLDNGADLLHIDVMDGHFAPNLTMGHDMVKALRKHLPDAYLDAHLMVEHPAEYIDRFAKAGANHFSFHFEVCRPFHANGQNADHIIDQIHDAGMEAGLVLNPGTDPANYADDLIRLGNKLEMILIMSVNPGYSGQSFMPEVLPKAKWIREHIKKDIRIQMDGGMDATTAPQAVAAGVDNLVAATAIFGQADRPAAIQAIKDAVQPHYT